jgi:hypothetical protein
VVLLVSIAPPVIRNRSVSLVRVPPTLASGPAIVILVDPESWIKTPKSGSFLVVTLDPLIWTRGCVDVVLKIPVISSNPPPSFMMELLFVAIKATPSKVDPPSSPSSMDINSCIPVVPVKCRVLFLSRKIGALLGRYRVRLSKSKGSVSCPNLFKVTVVSVKSSNVPARLKVFPELSELTKESAVREPPVILNNGPLVFFKVLALAIFTSELAPRFNVRFVESKRGPPDIKLAPPTKFTRFVKDRLPFVALSRGPDRVKEPPFIPTMSPPIEAVLLLNPMKGLLPVPVTVPPLMASRSFPAVIVPLISVKRGPESDKFAPDSTLKISPAAAMTLGSESRSVPVTVAFAPELTKIRLVPVV